MTSSAGYIERAPGFYHINPQNLTGSRLYRWLDRPQGALGGPFGRLYVTNACPELVTSAKGRGTPDVAWLSKNIQDIRSTYDVGLIIVCGKVAQNTYNLRDTVGARVVEVPHPAARMWSNKSLALAGKWIREGTRDISLTIERGRLVCRDLIPF